MILDASNFCCRTCEQASFGPKGFPDAVCGIKIDENSRPIVIDHDIARPYIVAYKPKRVYVFYRPLDVFEDATLILQLAVSPLALVEQFQVLYEGCKSTDDFLIDVNNTTGLTIRRGKVCG